MGSAHFSQIGWPELGQMNALPLQFLMMIFAGWVNRHQQDGIEYLQEEEAWLPSDRTLREQLGGRRLRFTDQQPYVPFLSGRRPALFQFMR